MKALYDLIFAAILISTSATTLAENLGCQSPPSLAQAMPIIEAGLCKNSVQFLGEPVCDDLRAFKKGTAPKLPVGSFAVGATFSAELSRSGTIAWSENSEMYALYNSGSTELLERIGLIDIEADNPAQQKEKSRYLSLAFSRHRDENSSLHKYIESMRDKAPATSLTSSASGMVGVFPCMTVYVRQNNKRIYALLSTKHETDYEIDSHPVIYFVIFAPP